MKSRSYYHRIIKKNRFRMKLDYTRSKFSYQAVGKNEKSLKEAILQIKS